MLALGLTGTLHDAWDVIIVGDGSGSRWGYPGGWAAVLFDRRTGLRKTLYGALSDTTVNIAELSPYLYAMQWYVRGPGKDLQKELRQYTGWSARVFIVTDCEIIAKQGNRKAERDANGALWAGMDYFARLNYTIHYKYLGRDQLAANRLCDALSKDMRHLITSIEQRLDETEFPDPYDDQFGRPMS
jgi:ribonuclease HI